MRPIEIFEDIAEIVTHECAGAEELVCPNLHEPFLNVCAQLSEHFGFEDEHLYAQVQLYLEALGHPNLTFEIQDHVGFQHTQRGFEARSDGTHLYVTAAGQEGQVRPGDRIASLSYQPPADFRSQALHLNPPAPALSERDSWDALLRWTRVMEVEREGRGLERVILEEYAPEPGAPQFVCRVLDRHTVYLRIDRFQEPAVVMRLLEENREPLAACERLLIDLRWAAGDQREAVLPLLPYLCDQEMRAADFFQDQEVYTRYSERNCELGAAQLRPFLASEDELTRDMAARLIADFDAKRGQGWALEQEEESDESITSRRTAQAITLLTDTDCAGEAEWLALGARRMPGVRLLGRPTRGSLDTCNLVSVEYGFGRTFTYPISKTKACHDGLGLARRGLPVDVYVPWSPAEIEEDLLLKKALS